MRISRERQQAILERSTKAGHLPPELLAEFTRQPSVRLCLDRMGAAELQLHPKTGYMTADIPMWILNYGDKYVTIEAVEITVNDALFPLLSLGLYQWLELKPNGRESHEVLKISGRAPRGLGATATCRVVVYFTNGRNAELSITLPVVQVKPGPSGSRRERSSDALDLRQLMAAPEEANGDRKASDTEEGGSAKPTLPSPLKRLRRKSMAANLWRACVPSADELTPISSARSRPTNREWQHPRTRCSSTGLTGMRARSWRVT